MAEKQWPKKSLEWLCAQVFKMKYILHICRLEEGGVLTDCSIQTQEPDETLDFDFSSAEVLNKIIMKVRELILTSSREIHVHNFFLNF